MKTLKVYDTITKKIIEVEVSEEVSGIMFCAHCGGRMTSNMHTEKYVLNQQEKEKKNTTSDTYATTEAENYATATDSRFTLLKKWTRRS